MVRSQLKKNPEFFTKEEIAEYSRYKHFYYTSFIDLGIYFFLLFTTKPVKLTDGKIGIFPSARMGKPLWRLIFLNLFFAENIVSSYRDSELKDRLATKYFSHIVSTN